MKSLEVSDVILLPVMLAEIPEIIPSLALLEELYIIPPLITPSPTTIKLFPLYY
ncbi:hypothetical protein IJ182_01550 [bacterium]|nr:hypothetical protein [bacterium]